MIQFNELRITPDGKKLVIDASVKDLNYYNDVYIDAIIIDSQNTYVSNGPSSKPIFYYEISNPNVTVTYPEYNGYVPSRQGNSGDINEKRVRLELDSKILGDSISTNLFFVYVIAKGTPSPDTPCGMDNQTTLGVVADLYPYYRSVMNGIKEISNECEIPRTFIDNLLRFKALELSLKTGNYIQAIKYWNKFFVGIKSSNINTYCKCHG